MLIIVNRSETEAHVSFPSPLLPQLYQNKFHFRPKLARFYKCSVWGYPFTPSQTFGRVTVKFKSCRSVVSAAFYHLWALADAHRGSEEKPANTSD